MEMSTGPKWCRLSRMECLLDIALGIWIAGMAAFGAGRLIFAYVLHR